MARFRAPVEYARSQDSGGPLVSRYAGLPVGLQLLSDCQVYHNDFLRASDFDATNDWTVTETGAAGTSALSADTSPSALVLTCDALDNDSQEAQLTAVAAGETWLLTGDRPLYFETMIRLRDANNDRDTVEQVDWFVGLAITDTTVIDGATDFIGFVKQDGTATAIQFVSGDAGGAAGALVDQLVSPTGWTALSTQAVAQAANRADRLMGPNQWIKLAFLVEPTGNGANGNVYVWVNNEVTAASPINAAGFIPDTELCVTLCVQNGEAVAKIMDIGYVLVVQSLFDDAGAMV